MFKYLNTLTHVLLPTVIKITVNTTRKSLSPLSLSIRNLVNSSQYYCEKCCKPIHYDPDSINKQLMLLKKRVFDKFDENKDGFLEYEELKRALKKALYWMTEKHIDYLCQGYEDKKVSFDDFQTLEGTMQGFQIFENMKNLDLFIQYDTNKDGYLDAKEAKKLINDLFAGDKDVTLPDSIVEEHYKNLLLYDKDKDGKITSDEFLKWTWSDDAIQIFEQDLRQSL